MMLVRENLAIGSRRKPSYLIGCLGSLQNHEKMLKLMVALGICFFLYVHTFGPFWDQNPLHDQMSGSTDSLSENSKVSSRQGAALLWVAVCSWHLYVHWQDKVLLFNILIFNKDQ